MASDYTVKAPDDKEIRFGDDDDFKLKYDSAAARFELLDAADNVLAYIEDDGTTATITAVGALIQSGNYTGLSSEDLLGLWRCESLTTMPDWSGNGDAATENGSGTSVVTGKYGSGLSFDGNGYYEAGSSIPSNNGTSSFTLSAWVKTSTASAMNVMGWTGGASGEIARLSIGANGNANFVLRDTGAANVRSAIGSTDVADGNWHHLVAVRDYNANIYIYVDGVQDGSTTDGTGDVGDAVNIAIGAITSGGGPLTGTLGTCAVWGRALGAAEIRELYKRGSEWGGFHSGGRVGGDFTVAGDLTVTGGGSLGDANTDVFTMTGRLAQRQINSATPNTDVAGTTGEMAFNTNDSKFYGCTSGGSAGSATWAALH